MIPSDLTVPYSDENTNDSLFYTPMTSGEIKALIWP
jgi:hypothetical protein